MHVNLLDLLVHAGIKTARSNQEGYEEGKRLNELVNVKMGGKEVALTEVFKLP